MLNKFVRLLGGDPNKRTIDKFSGVVEEINSIEARFSALSEVELSSKTAEFRQRLAVGETLNDLLPEAFAVVREACKRTLGLRHYDVQMVGGIALHNGNIAEMRTGEGKTLVATLPLYLNALVGRGVHLVTVNDYLARRDARWMAPIYTSLGMTVGVLQMAARTENGKKAFLVDMERESPHEDQHHLRMVPRRDAYATDILYGTNSEFGFDYLRDNMNMRLNERVQRGHYYAIVDEVDNILIDEARTPLIISGPASEDTGWYVRMAQVVRQLRGEDYEVNEKDRSVSLTEGGETHVEELLGMALRDPDRPEDVTPEQARLMGYLEQALRAQHLFHRNKDYLVQAGKVIIVDEFTGRLMPGRRWSDGLHQAVEAKEGARVQAENVTYATITIQNYFRMYTKLAGMTGTAVTEAEEFHKIYKLDVLAIPTNLEYLASKNESGMVETEGRDENGYKYRFYCNRDDAEKKPLYWRRKDYPDVVYRTEEAKFRAIAADILRNHAIGRPVLVGTTSVELSERLSARLKAESLNRLAQVLILRRAYFRKNNSVEDGRQETALQFLNQPLDQIPLSDMRKLGRDLGVSFNPQDAESLVYLSEALDVAQEYRQRLVASLKGGIPHQVLNARKHTEESQIIAGAGAFGAVTIATNMAGRGVDIILGGDFPGEDLYNILRIARNSSQRLGRAEDIQYFRQILSKGVDALGYGKLNSIRRLIRWRKQNPRLDAEDVGIYDTRLQAFDNFIQDYEHILKMGGLHVIGSERHEARRIDNQLRGRSARQGDPGSSRFYLSMQDELMRLFGGQQAESVMQRFKIDDAMPLEVGVVGRLVEQSQTRVEGANFDMRKHLLEYDDVLNSQRARIYGQRDRIFTKDDLSEDVAELLRAELTRRVPEALKDGEDPWKLLAWLDQVQPPFQYGNGMLYPSFTLSLLVDRLLKQKSAWAGLPDVRQALLDLASDALNAEFAHLQRQVRIIVDNTYQRLESQIKERLETLETFFEGLDIDEGEEEGSAPKNPRAMVEDLSNALRMPVKLSLEQQRYLRERQKQVMNDLRLQVEETQKTQSLIRLLGSVERRLGEALELTVAQLIRQSWDQLEELVFTGVETAFQKRRERLLGDGNGASASGQIAKDLDVILARKEASLDKQAIVELLYLLPQGSRTAFDKKTHRRVWQRTTRLSYTFLAAQLLSGMEVDEVTNLVLAHLEGAQAAFQSAWGESIWSRLAGARWDDLNSVMQSRLQVLLSEEKRQALQKLPISNLESDDIGIVKSEAGRQALAHVYRRLLLGVITDLWVEYLTQMEALRVSIGLEAYAQRDPLVQYKSKASELFAELLSNMRLEMVMRMFTYRLRDASALPVGLRGSDEEREEIEGQTGQLEVQSAGALPEAKEEQAPALPDIEPTQEEENDTAVELSRSQKRRRRRH